MTDERKGSGAAETPLARTEMLLGADALKRPQEARIAVFGVGGVGGYVTEALARSGVGRLDLIDADVVAVSNLNRQIYALRSTIGRPKVEVARDRILDINPDCEVRTYQMFFLPENKDQFDFAQYTYIVDAIDTVSGKLALAECAEEAGVPMISAMGAGNKLDPSRFEVADIYETSVCPLAKVMRQECRKRGIRKLKVVYSKETALPVQGRTPGSVAFVPGAAGLVIAGAVIRDIAGIAGTDPAQRR